MFYVSPDAPPDEVNRVRERLGLDQPVMTRFTFWLGEVFQGNLGVSFHQNRPVLDAFMDALPVTLWLAGFSMIIALVVGIRLGCCRPCTRMERSTASARFSCSSECRCPISGWACCWCCCFR